MLDRDRKATAVRRSSIETRRCETVVATRTSGNGGGDGTSGNGGGDRDLLSTRCDQGRGSVVSMHFLMGTITQLLIVTTSGDKYCYDPHITYDTIEV